MKTAQTARRFTFSEWGGTETVVWNTAKKLAELADTTEIIATDALDKNGIEQKDNVTIRRLSYFYPYFPLSKDKVRTLDKKGGNPYVPSLSAILKNGNYDLIHCHTMGRIARTVAKTAKKMDIPYVMSFHGGCLDVPQQELNEMLAPIRKTLKYGGIIDRIANSNFDPVSRADLLLCVGKNELEPLRKKYPSARVEYLPNGIDTKRFASPATVSFRETYNISRSARMILCVARIDYQKNQTALAELVARLPDTHLVLIGPPSSEWYFEKLKNTVSNLKIENRTTIIPGLAPDSEILKAAYNEADIFMLGSIHEPFGIVIPEAWSAKIPVIVSETGGLAHIVRHGENGFFTDFSNPDATADFIKSLTQTDLERTARQGYEEAINDYSWDNITSRLRKLYSETIESHRKKR